MSTETLPFTDTVGAWMPHGHFTLPGRAGGPLQGLRFAAKDLFDVAGRPTSAGNPAWLASHPLPTRSSPLIEALLDAGASLAGKVLTDELAYSIHGDNRHYGTPINSAAPQRVTGGSSSGSAAAVAARLVDFALGTDTGGSTRVPASYCGLWGLRPTHGLLSQEGLVPLHPSFDTPTWLAHQGDTFERVAQVLLPASSWQARRVLCLQDAWDEAEPEFQQPLRQAAAALGRLLDAAPQYAVAAPQGLEAWRQTYVTASAHEGWQVHGAWIAASQPDFAPPIAARWAFASTISDSDAAAARQRQAEVRARMLELLGTDGVAVLPSAASLAPLRDADPQAVDAVRMRTLRITCIAGLAGLPQVSLPWQDAQGVPLGLSLMGAPGSDRALIALALRLRQALPA